MKILVLNAGSSSLKYEVWETEPERRLQHGEMERTTDLDAALGEFFRKSPGLAVDAVGHRVVHGGDLYHASVLIDEAVEKNIEALCALAPLHNPHNLEAIRAARKHFPRSPQVAAFDTAFHHTLTPHAFAYALPWQYLNDKKIRRYGFHGISHRYVSQRFAGIAKPSAGRARLITCHLGNGCSVCAIEDGRSVDTSMGFTPLEGLVMGTRSGDVDAGAILHLILRENVRPDDLLQILNSDSGLLGLSGVSNDMRDILKQTEAGNSRAALALETFCYRVRKYIGSYMAAMNGADALIFTGGIGENAAEVRRRICADLDQLGIEVDAEANHREDRTDRQIGSGKVPVWVVPTNEELLIARDTAACVKAAQGSPSK